jgi:hypothetical protein
MLDRIVMNKIDMLLQVFFVTDRMFPLLALPDTNFSLLGLGLANRPSFPSFPQ